MKFIYNGPSSGVTLRDGEAETEVMLHDGAEVDLPAEHEYTKTLEALGHLTAVIEKPAKASKTATAEGA
ncbi:hypothetical protein WAE56_20250 [Iodobacter sp. LRB]|uniref:hypothetical protein n=1 Tax=unclassified Iodobacter TaxID=235634 RepID=UPI000C107AF1|nr:hypothetical protein [Iodobacter sp. BJB302]PHV01536.1 hypothetical protein CSQ88_11865 [Iodobacter sp. BJB302]